MTTDRTELLDIRYGERLRALREQKGMTQAELVDRLKAAGVGYMNASTLSRIEAGTRPVRLVEAQFIGHIFAVSLESMMSELEALSFYELSARRGREAFVRFRKSVADVVQWKLDLSAHLPHLRSLLDETDEPAVRTVIEETIQNVESFIEIDLEDELRGLDKEVRETHERQDTSTAGRFLNSTRR
ncbi:helix-turn-helix domain-containing protein [Microbacterium imperiale]|uniref:HTH cro/C1-type domain-containing protein n=1 Tax=Microbacterium imperiale TaxID=33884 RepID=A0A9W6HGQ5_9MICO|nr:helix-turn-helix transcriptional regulator [Microbacterium imperiale]MBP2422079.1 transcriptional regulator with XRE-family HTH domain [Microbacterium imperiale]MDS0200238.1 helix-turn-helix domain-containing protein [Microbacterium imperiale]BFE39390.1 hypothetical protein GCM10017544_03460 [Microbacterium imperiale]GLJ79743.1 hypothetical protein GCM10017586_14250 [Microbacterium imperiale]